MRRCYYCFLCCCLRPVRKCPSRRHRRRRSGRRTAWFCYSPHSHSPVSALNQRRKEQEENRALCWSVRAVVVREREIETAAAAMIVASDRISAELSFTRSCVPASQLFLRCVAKANGRRSPSLPSSSSTVEGKFGPNDCHYQQQEHQQEQQHSDTLCGQRLRRAAGAAAAAAAAADVLFSLFNRICCPL